MLPSNDGDPPLVDASGPSFYSGYVTPNLQAAFQLGIATPQFQRIPALEPVCKTGDCDFPIFSTLAVCAETRNVTDMLTIGNSSIKAGKEFNEFMGGKQANRIPHRWEHNRGRAHPKRKPPDWRVHDRRAWIAQLEHILRFFAVKPHLLGSAIIDFFVLWLNHGYFESDEQVAPRPTSDRVEQSFRASEILLHFCVKTYNVSVRAGRSTTTLTHSETRVKTTNGTMKSADGMLWPNYTLLTTSKNESAMFGVEEMTFNTLFYYLRRMIRGTCGEDSWVTGSTVNDQTPTSEAIANAFWSDETGEPATSNPIPKQDDMQGERIQNISRNLADSLTNSMRQQVSSFAEWRKPIVFGTAYHDNYVLVHWPFLTLLIAQVTISIVILAAVMFQTQLLDVDILKSDLMPVLLAIDAEDKTRLLAGDQDQTINAAREMAPRVIGGLERRGSGWILK
ncbi:hypothetical protein AK830_g9513 [Neonectria ditissima]|uniref:Uncharacterized protein n=1 Tax=Neonectria ditissima TaxID=78410 RepID=A0A0P7AHV3_9HYPO|nr:hypothetical protein AK830_g9513 [Neonectria ditissima]